MTQSFRSKVVLFQLWDSSTGFYWHVTANFPQQGALHTVRAVSVWIIYTFRWIQVLSLCLTYFHSDYILRKKSFLFLDLLCLILCWMVSPSQCYASLSITLFKLSSLFESKYTSFSLPGHWKHRTGFICLT